jgi:hypothetical protein
LSARLPDGPRTPTPATAARRRGRACPPGQTPATPPRTSPPPTHPTPFDRGRPANDPGAAARAEAEPTEPDLGLWSQVLGRAPSARPGRARPRRGRPPARLRRTASGRRVGRRAGGSPRGGARGPGRARPAAGLACTDRGLSQPCLEPEARQERRGGKDHDV